MNQQGMFDKVLLSTLVLIFAGLAFRGYHLGNDQLSAFAADSCKLFSGALLTLITGRALLSRNGDKPNGNGGSHADKTNGDVGNGAGANVVGNGK